MENKVNEAADQGKANFEVEQIVDQLIERILDKRPLPLESDCLLDICIKVKKCVSSGDHPLVLQILV